MDDDGLYDLQKADLLATEVVFAHVFVENFGDFGFPFGHRRLSKGHLDEPFESDGRPAVGTTKVVQRDAVLGLLKMPFEFGEVVAVDRFVVEDFAYGAGRFGVLFEFSNENFPIFVRGHLFPFGIFDPPSFYNVVGAVYGKRNVFLRLPVLHEGRELVSEGLHRFQGNVFPECRRKHFADSRFFFGYRTDGMRKGIHVGRYGGCDFVGIFVFQ